MRIKITVLNQLRRSSTTSTPYVNPAMQFPCLDKSNEITERLKDQLSSKASKRDASMKNAKNSSSDDPVYGKIQSGYKLYNSNKPIFLDYGGILQNFDIAYETWGTLNEDKSNAILIHTGLSASSHAHSSPENLQPGWWEKFIGPNNEALDSNKWFLICTNVLGGCYGSTGPSSINSANGSPYATRFPMLSIQDIIRSQNRLVTEQFGIKKLYASIGSSMGGLQSLSYGQQFPDQVDKIVSVSACARSHPSSIAMRHAQRQVLMADPHWNRGFYYPTVEEPYRIPPHVGMKLAREIATVTYRSGPEWESRFGTERLDDDRAPVLCPDFLIERYLDHQGEKFSLEYDANSFLYLSKTMDLFDLSKSHSDKSKVRREQSKRFFESNELDKLDYESNLKPSEKEKKKRTTTQEEAYQNLKLGMKPLTDKEVLVIGVKSDGLFPYWQQREVYELLGGQENNKIEHVELAESDSIFGHDTFLLDFEHVGKSIGRFLRDSK